MSAGLRQEYTGGSRLADDPLIYLFEEYLSRAECEHLIELSQPHMQRAVVSGGTEGVQSDGRTGRACWLQHGETATTRSISERTAGLVGLPLANAESIQVISYSPGEEYKPHYDAWEAGTEAGNRCLARGGQRLVTCLFYLSSAEGGSTCFPGLELVIHPSPGRMVLFHNCYPGTALRHPGSLHGGMPPSAGTKWACNIWFRARNYCDPDVAAEQRDAVAAGH